MSQQINLYEARLRPRHELATARNLGICTLVLLMLMTTLSLWVRAEASRKSETASALQKHLAEEQEKLTSLTRLFAQRQVSPGLIAERERTKTMLAASEEVIKVLDSGMLGNTEGFSGVMTGFARQSQTDLWLTGFRVTGSGEIEIQGRLLDPEKLPAYVQRLRSEPVFQGRRFATLEMRGVDPEEQAPEQAGVTGVAEKIPAAEVPSRSVPRLPRYVEFILRSENVGNAGNAGNVEASTKR